MKSIDIIKELEKWIVDKGSGGYTEGVDSYTEYYSGTNPIEGIQQTKQEIKEFVEYLNDKLGNPVINLKTNFFNLDLSITDVAKELISKVDYIIHLADIVAGIDYVFKNQGEIFRQNNLINSNVISNTKDFKEKIY